MAMTFTVRLVVISANLVLVVLALAVGIGFSEELDPQMAEILDIEQKWLLGAAVMYTTMFLISWRFKGVFSVSATRMLAWAIVAYLALSHGIDMLGEYRSDIFSVIGVESGRLEDSVVLGIRVRLFGLFAILAMAITSIAVGFETSE
jgi:hypothetical protein